jgi:hypothetical protein
MDDPRIASRTVPAGFGPQGAFDRYPQLLKCITAGDPSGSLTKLVQFGFPWGPVIGSNFMQEPCSSELQIARVVTSAIANNAKTVKMLSSGRRNKSLRGSVLVVPFRLVPAALKSLGSLEAIATADARRNPGKVSSAVESGTVKTISNPSSI